MWFLQRSSCEARKFAQSWYSTWRKVWKSEESFLKYDKQRWIDNSWWICVLLVKIAFEFSSDLFQHDFLKSFLSSNAQAKQIYLVSLRERISFSGDVESLLKKCCKDGHAFEMFYDKICGTIFNMSAKNFVSDINSNIHLQKRSKCSEKTSKCKVKIKKLQSR